MNKAEEKIQQEIFMYFQNKYCLKFHKPRYIIFHVANEGQQHLTRIGVLGGVSDLIIVGNYPLTIYVEVKTLEGTQKPNQKEFEKRVTDLGWKYLIVRSLEDFINLVEPLMYAED